MLAVLEKLPVSTGNFVRWDGSHLATVGSRFLSGVQTSGEFHAKGNARTSRTERLHSTSPHRHAVRYTSSRTMQTCSSVTPAAH